MNDLIYNQKKIPKRQWRYGLRSSAATGCGWNGNIGTFLFGPAIFFMQKGFSVKVTVRRKKFDKLVKDSNVCVMFYYWHRRFRFGAHFVAVRYQEGKFVGYNTYSNSVGPDIYGESLEEFLKKRSYHFPVLMAVRDKRKKCCN